MSALLLTLPTGSKGTEKPGGALLRAPFASHPGLPGPAASTSSLRREAPTRGERAGWLLQTRAERSSGWTTPGS